MEVEQGNPFIVNIESKKKFHSKKASKGKKKEVKEEEEVKEVSDHSDSVIIAEDVRKLQPILVELKKSLKIKNRKSKSKSKSCKRKPKKNPLYKHVKSKVAESIKGAVSVKSFAKKRRTKKRRVISEARSVRTRARSIRSRRTTKHRSRHHKAHSKPYKSKCKSKASRKTRAKSGHPKTEIISDSAYSIKPLNIRTELAVKLFPDSTSQKPSFLNDVSSSFVTKSVGRSTAKSQASWLKRNAAPKKAKVSDYEQYENNFIKCREERMQIASTSFDETVSLKLILCSNLETQKKRKMG